MANRPRNGSSGNAGKAPGRLGNVLWIVADRALDHLDDIGAVLLAMLGVLSLLGLLSLTQGSLLLAWAGLLTRWLGWGAYSVPIVLLLAAAGLGRLALGSSFHVPWVRVISLEFAVFSLLGLISIVDGLSLVRAEGGGLGGLVGWGLGTLLADLLGLVGASVALAAVALLGAFYGLRGLHMPAGRWLRAGASPSIRGAEPSPEFEAPSIRELNEIVTGRSAPRSAQRLPAQFRKNFRVPEAAEERAAPPEERDERLPSLELLEEGVASRISAREINRTAGLIEKTLADFGLPVRVVDFNRGPAVTQFAVEPGFIEQVGPEGDVRRQKVRVSQISSLANDLALSLSATRVRIQAPVPGQSYVGIEVPNHRAALVRLRPILESEAFLALNAPLAVALGRDVSGASTAGDLGGMPHLLIGGTTGSGKSVFITALATCLVLNNTPEDMRLVMIDPKRVELIRFNRLPHLFGKVETDLDRIVGVLRWCTAEMDRRYRLLESARARHIDSYNRRAARKRSGERLPRIVVLVDELADLMMMAPDQTERTLVRLAQMGRATGLHLVVATQRPSTDIVTGLIKANFPARVSFSVASGIDSRVILDMPGAETLLGRGDLLYLAPESASPVRLQGVYCGDAEVERVVEYWRGQLDREELDQAPPWEDLLARDAVLEDRDEIITEALQVVKEEGQASASLLQRRLRIGYPRAARLMDELEELGVIGESESGGRRRDVLIQDDEDPLEPRPE